jgi:hypothetical protein
MEKRITLRIPGKLYERLINEAGISHRSVSDIAREGIKKEVGWKNSEPFIEKFRYRRISDKAMGEVVWQFGVTKSGKEFKIGPFFQEDIYDLLRSLPDVLTTEELIFATEVYLKVLRRAEKDSKDLKKFWEEITRRRKNLSVFLEKTRRILRPDDGWVVE